MRFTRVPTACLVFAALLIPGGGRAARGEEPLPLDPGPLLERLVARFVADEEALRAFYDTPLCAERAGRLAGFYAGWARRLAALDPAGLDADAQVDHALLEAEVQHELARLDVERARRAEVLGLAPFAPALVELECARRRRDPVEPRAAAGRLDAARRALAERRRAFEPAAQGGSGEAPPPAWLARRAAAALDALRQMLGRWFEFRDGYEPDFGWWVRAPHAALARALTEYAAWLRDGPGGGAQGEAAPLVGEPLGRDGLERELAHERIPYAPEDLIALAERDLAWCDAEGARVAREELGLEDFRAAVEHVKGLAVPPGAQDDLVAAQGREAVAFVTEHDLVTVPPLCAELWRLAMIPAERQRTMPFAFYSGQAMHLAYPSEAMEHEAKEMSMRGNNPHFTRIVTPHELIPGHHLQLFMAARHRPYRERFRTPFLVEGWALHWEMLLYDKGWARGPEDRIGMLFWRRHRCARILVTLRFHLGEWDAERLVAFLVDTVGLEPDGARAEVRRYLEGSYGPLYQCAYMVGGLQMRALYREQVEGQGMGARAFHDAVLREGPIPIDLIRRRLRGEGARRGDPPWRFADPPPGAGAPGRAPPR